MVKTTLSEAARGFGTGDAAEENFQRKGLEMPVRASQ